MHELAITQSILDIALKAAAAQNAARIRAIRLKIGAFSGVVPECVQMYLDVLAKGIDIRIGARLPRGRRSRPRTVPLRVQCRACGATGEIDRRHVACPACGSVDLHRLSGREFYVDSIEVDV